MQANTNSEHFLLLYSRLFRPVSRAFFRLLFRLLSRVRITSVENIPKDGGYVIVGNHVPIFEQALIAAF